MTNKSNEHKAKNEGPDPELLKPGRGVFVKWTNGITYKGIVRKKLRENYSIEIDDDQWNYSSNLASVPAYALIPNWYPNAKIEREKHKPYENNTVQ
jgi:hypothetical protein